MIRDAESPRKYAMKRKFQTQPGRYLIEGERLTYADIAHRLGLSTGQAEHRMRKAKEQPGPITWERLASIRRMRT